MAVEREAIKHETNVVARLPLAVMGTLICVPGKRVVVVAATRVGMAAAGVKAGTFVMFVDSYIIVAIAVAQVVVQERTSSQQTDYSHGCIRISHFTSASVDI
jgi:hypothetical protein